MKADWLIKENNDNIILFFSGWGMDPNPFREITSSASDVLIIYDYRDLSLPVLIKPELEKYNKQSIIAWSLGVAVAENTMRKFPSSDWDQVLALNGTPYPADDEYGIPVSIFDKTIESLSLDNLKRFYRRMCGNSALMQEFMTNKPQRDICDLRSELEVLRKQQHSNESIFRFALISNKDAIVPADNQVRCWEKLDIECQIIEGGHFAFDLYKNWEDIFHAKP